MHVSMLPVRLGYSCNHSCLHKKTIWKLYSSYVGTDQTVLNYTLPEGLIQFPSKLNPLAVQGGKVTNSRTSSSFSFTFFSLKTFFSGNNVIIIDLTQIFFLK